MNTLIKVLTEKLKVLGYNELVINSVLSKLDISLVENNLRDVEDYSKYIDVYQYDEPTVELTRAFLNINHKFIQTEILEGDIKSIPAENIFRYRFVTADYLLSKRCAVISISTDFRIKIYVYAPTQRTQILFDGKTYESAYKKERDEVTNEYKLAFERNRKLQAKTIEQILNMLISDFIIDEMIVSNLNPRVKMYDEPDKYAENITSYSLRYINNRTNRVEIFEKEASIRRIGTDVFAGICNNDPYIKLSEMPKPTNFPINRISYYWVSDNGKGQEEIAIYTAVKEMEYESYIEFKQNSSKVNTTISDINFMLNKMKNMEQIEGDYSEFINEVVKTLNIDLIIPQVEIIRGGLENPNDIVFPLEYRFNFITNPSEFEQNLYVSIEDNIGRNYKYKLSENILEDLTRIGNKLEYTNDKGEFVKRQSIADFNVNSPAAIIRKETFIDASRINDLLAYIYEDVEGYGTKKLPIPSIYVYIYIPKNVSSSVSMYNGTSLDFSLDEMKSNTLFYNDSNQGVAYISGGDAMPGSTSVRVRYLNSKGEVLKENRIRDLMPGTSFVPEILPIINDSQGKEWVAELKRLEPYILKSDSESNVINLKYIEKYARVNFSFISRDGKKIAEDKQEIRQVGEVYDFEKKKTFTTEDNDEWILKYTRPLKFVVKENEEDNKVILMYDVERTDILIKYINKETGEPVAESKTNVVTANKKYSIDVPKFIIDSKGLGWNYIEGTNTNILAEKNVINEVVLYYTEAKVPVIIKYKNKNNVSLIDDKVNLIQIGKKYTYDFENELTDFGCREWYLKENQGNKEIIVDKDKNKNIIEAIYEPLLANVTVRFVNADNRALKSDIIESAQIGDYFNFEALEEIVDNFGKAWKCINKGEKIIVKSKEIENQIVLRYEPLTSKIKIRYLDLEMNELIEPKFETLQVGVEYKNKPIEKVTDKEGKRWKVDYGKINSIIVKKHEEENIYTIYYDKENAKVKLSFYDAYNNKLKDDQKIEWQIGARLETKSFEKISDNKNGRWMLETSEPKNLIVKENNNEIKLIYGEVKSKVLVKFIDIKTQKPIIENLVTTIKLGGIYIPNIQKKILDQNKYRYKYVGDDNISIVTKENEQENIIVLNYEEDKAKVILKYQDIEGIKIREDAVKEVQIGKEIKVDPIEKFADNNALVWKYKSLQMNNQIVDENDNIINLTYEPLLSEIRIKYVDENGISIINDKILNMQVGKEFAPEILERIIGNDSKVWIYNKISEEKIIVKEEKNEIVMTFEKLMKNISVQLVDESGALLKDADIYSKQVGENFEIPYKSTHIDAEGKVWTLIKAETEIIKTSEDEAQNIVKIIYRKELIEVKINYYNELKEKIYESTKEKVQIGSIYKPVLLNEIIDEKNKLGWKLPENYRIEHKVKNTLEKNILDVIYEKLYVKVFVKNKSLDNIEITEETIYNEQVGTKFTPKIENIITDAEGKEWLHKTPETNKLFGENKAESIIVGRDEEKNNIDISYEPSLAKVTIKYQEALGNQLAREKIVEAQIGSIYEAEIIEELQDNKNIKWIYNPNSKSNVKVSHDEKTNIIILAYEEQKALVTYKYQDEYGNRLRTPKRKLVQIGSTHIPEVENIIEDYQGKFWEYKARSYEKIEIKEDESVNVVDIIYEPLKVDTILRFVNSHGNAITKEVIVKAQLGSEFIPNIQEKITNEESKLFKFVKCVPESIKVQEMQIGALESPNVFELTYEPVYGEIVITYKTIDGEKIKNDEIKQEQVGTIFDAPKAQYIKDEKGIEWELISKDIDSIRIKEDARENVIQMVYEIAKTEVTIRYRDIVGNEIYPSEIIPIEVGKEFIPEIQKEIIDESNKKWIFSVAEPVKLTVGSINNIITLTYNEKKAEVIVKYKTQDGKTLKEDYKTKIQIGTRYEPQNTTKVLYEDNDVWRFGYNEPSVIVISENESENIITQVYTKEERKEEVNETNKTYYNPEIEKFIDKELVEQAKKEEEKEEESIATQEATIEQTIFEDENLKALENSIILTQEEKKTINKLNECNDEIIEYLNNIINQKEKIDYAELENLLNTKINIEKNIIQQEFINFIQEDKTGRMLLKVFEAITSSEKTEKNINILQERKSILIADYFINTQITEVEQATYICNKGIIEKSIECIDEKLAMPINPKDKTRTQRDEEYLKQKILLIYEKVILNNYSKARSVVKDDYFKNMESKGLIAPEVVIIVSNTLPKQAFKLISKINELSIIKENELDAIIKLMNTQQLGTLTMMVEKIQDGKIRKNALRKIKE